MIATRLQELRAELEKGGRQMLVLEGKRAELRDTMLRIEGAIQVLEELSALEESPRPALARTP